MLWLQIGNKQNDNYRKVGNKQTRCILRCARINMSVNIGLEATTKPPKLIARLNSV